MTGEIYPTCPYCQTEFSDEELWHDDEISTGDCDVSTAICKNDDCKKSFSVTCVHHIRFESEEEEE